MDIAVHPTWLIATSLCSLRLGTALILSPFFAFGGTPLRVRALMTCVFSACLVSIKGWTAIGQVDDVARLINLGATELVVGALMGFGIHAAFAAFQFAGAALDLQMGFNVGSLFDPINHHPSSIMTTILTMVGVMLFFASGTYHGLVRALAFSLDQLPVGTGVDVAKPDLMLKQFGSLFIAGTLLAAPILSALFLVELALAVASRNLPQMNVFTLGMPVKIVVGLVLLAILTPHLDKMSERIFNGLLVYQAQVL